MESWCIMNYIVLDLEWNQAAFKVDEEGDLPFEIIEIGAIKLDKDANIIDEFQSLIRPQVYPFLLRRTRELTGWTDRDLDEKGVYFDDICPEFLKWCGKDCVFVVWGGSDLTQLERNMAYYKLPIPWKYPLKYLDAQKLYALQENEGKVRRTLESVVEKYELPMDRPFHHAIDDAFYTAKIFKLLNRPELEEYYSVDYYFVPKNRFEEKTFVFPTYTKFVSRSFNLKEEALENHRVRETNCRLCGKRMRRIIPWFSDGRTYLCLAECKEHGLMRGRIRLKVAERYDGFFAVRTIKTCNEEERKVIEGKKEALKEKRREKRQRTKTKKKKGTEAKDAAEN